MCPFCSTGWKVQSELNHVWEFQGKTCSTINIVMGDLKQFFLQIFQKNKVHDDQAELPGFTSQKTTSAILPCYRHSLAFRHETTWHTLISRIWRPKFCYWILCHAKAVNFPLKNLSHPFQQDSTKRPEEYFERRSLSNWSVHCCTIRLRAVGDSSGTCSSHCVLWPGAIYILRYSKLFFKDIQPRTFTPYLGATVSDNYCILLITFSVLCFLKLI